MDNSGQTYSVCFVCSGNICRSPMADVVFKAAIEQAGLAEQVNVWSGGTGDWHVGEHADPRAIDCAAKHGFDLSQHRAKVFEAEHAASTSLMVALDTGHQSTLGDYVNGQEGAGEVRLLRSFDPAADQGASVADPYYGDPEDFEIAMQQILDATPGIVEYVKKHLNR